MLCHHIITWHYHFIITSLLSSSHLLYNIIIGYYLIAHCLAYYTPHHITLHFIDWLVGLINGRVKRYNWFRLSLFNLLSQHHMAHYKYTCPGIITQTYITSIRSWYSSIILGLGFIYLLFGQGLAVNCLFIPSTIKK